MLLTLSAALVLPLATLAVSAADTPPPPAVITATSLIAVPTRDQKIIKRWSLPGEPRGIAIGKDGTLYVGLAETQTVVAIDPKNGDVLKRVVLDSADIAATKELLTLRTNPEGSRLFIANGSDESASILSLPDLHVIREITTEGEPIRDALPDPAGRYLFLLGHRVHVFGRDGETELRKLDFPEPMAIAISHDGAMLAVIGSNDFGGTKATVVALYETKNFTEIGHDPLQTDQQIESALFAAGDRVLVAFSHEHLYEKAIGSGSSTPKPMQSVNGQMRMKIDFGDLTSSQRICLPDGSGPQIAALAPGDLVFFAERRCSSSGAFTGSTPRITPASLYGIDADSIAYAADTGTLAVTDKAGYLTIYRAPHAAVAR